MRFSVLMTTYNDEEYIRDSISSALNQSVDDYEIIIVDESTDKTGDIINNEFNDDRIFYYRPMKKLGRQKSLNRGLDFCNGDYVAILDADDIWNHNKLDKQYKYMKDNDLVACASYYIVRREDENGDVISRDDCRDSVGDCVEPEDMIGMASRNKHIESYNDMLPFTNPIEHSTFMIKKDVIGKLGRYNDDYTYGEDYDLYIRLSKRGYSIGMCPYYLSTVRRHHDNAFIGSGYSRWKRLYYTMMLRWKACDDISDYICTLDIMVYSIINTLKNIR